MKKRSLLLSLAIILFFGFRSYATVAVTISTGVSDTVCSGTSLTFTATPGTGSYGYIWNVNGGYAGTSSPTFTTSTLPNGVDTVYCILTNEAGDTIYSVSSKLLITVNTAPVIYPITSPITPAAVCIGDSLNLTDTALGGVWFSSNTAAATVSGTGGVLGISLPVGGGGGGPSIRIYYAVGNTCGADTVRITVGIATPASAIELTSSTICLDSSLNVADSARGGTWTSSNTTVASLGFVFGMGGPPSEGVTGNSVGTATITYSGTNACGTYTETVNVTIVDCSTGVPNIVSTANSCSIYPNPSTGAFNIKVESDKYSEANCTVSNMVGEKVKNFMINTNQETAVDMSIPTGVYFITVSAGDEKYTSKIVIVQ